MVAIDVVGQILVHSGIELKADAAVQLFQEAFFGPAVPQEEELQTGALAIFAQHFAVAEDASDRFQDRQRLVWLDEGVQAARQMRIGRKSSGHAQRKPIS